MKKISQDVLTVLDRCTFSGPELRLPEQLDRKLYVDVAKVIELAGGKWNKKAKAHLFAADAAGEIEPVILTGEISNAKQDFGQFDTPMPLARDLVALAKIEPGMMVYEPHAGIGNLVAAVLEATKGGAKIFGNEIDPKRHAKCVERNFHAFGSGGLGMADFLTVEPNPVFDVVLMNPPFAKGVDVRHVLHAAQFLRTGGRLVSVMSAGVTFRNDALTSGFRHIVEERGGKIEMLPEDSFKASGTSVNTVLVSFPAAA